MSMILFNNIFKNKDQNQTRVFVWEDLFFFSIILLACVKITYDITHIVDLMFADESFYLSMGAAFRMGYLFRDGGFYFLWLKLLTALTPNLILAYCWNYAILVSINPLLMYILFRKMGRRPFSASFFSLFFLVTGLNVISWPFVTRFALAIFLLMLIGILSVKENLAKYGMALIGFFILAYSRPEFTMSLILFTVCSTIFFTYKTYQDKIPKQKILKYGWVVVLPLIMVAFVFFIKNPTRGQRSIFAFGQHYGFNMQKTGELKNIDTWANWREVMLQKFDTDRSLVRAFLNNPREVVRHISMNIRQFPFPFFYQLFPFFSYHYHPPAKRIIKYFILFLFMIPVVFFIWKMVKQKPRGMLRENDKWLYGMAILGVLPALFGIIVIFPRTHYLLMLFGIIFCLLIWNMPRWIDTRLPTVDFMVKAVIVLVVLLWIPWKASGSFGILPKKIEKSCSYITRVLTIRGIGVQGDVHLLESFMPENIQGGNYLELYLSDQSDHSYRVHHFFKKASFDEFMKATEINMVYVDKTLLKRWPLVSDLGRTGNWTRINGSGCGEYVWVRSELLKKNY
ncbi:MAG: hypothetical protein ACM3SY_02110 [Candidatus Omnitrophota bacterium]